MDCNNVNRDELMDRFIRDELSDQEADIFEEHLLYCSECRKELAVREEIINAIQKQAAGDVFSSGKQRKSFSWKSNKIYWYVAAAAGIALVIGLFLLPDRKLPSGSADNAINEKQTDQAKDLQIAADSTEGLIEKSEEKTTTIQETDPALLAVYQVHPFYENQIGVGLRSGDLVVESPPDSIECKSGSSIDIQYRNAEKDSLFLVILDNKGEILHEQKIASSHQFQVPFSKGLYYLQLTDDEETLHTGKIIVR